jgi:hypothetical protein
VETQSAAAVIVDKTSDVEADVHYVVVEHQYLEAEDIDVVA